MTLEERVVSAIRVQTDQLEPTIPDLPLIRASAKRQTRRRTSVAVACVVAVLVSFLWCDSTEWHLIAPVIALVIVCVGFVAARHTA